MIIFVNVYYAIKLLCRIIVIFYVKELKDRSSQSQNNRKEAFKKSRNSKIGIINSHD